MIFDTAPSSPHLSIRLEFMTSFVLDIHGVNNIWGGVRNRRMMMQGNSLIEILHAKTF